MNLLSNLPVESYILFIGGCCFFYFAYQLQQEENIRIRNNEMLKQEFAEYRAKLHERWLKDVYGK